ncbi:Ppx/GppA family phosphatase [Leeia sp. TBRC 13508]|uniref:Ppx/GppA family phosphatase n=1 Tax=Leeia speluncae TaxID=2884804 RepID=A0ABS8D9I3_9NEIS|nr:Ppx/GppA family phosphatase [Leeia speluncae]MCB6184881.1 Ppx/GppA family phosphatase [Leeia speluncae]
MPSDHQLFAAIDLGSNAFRMTIGKHPANTTEKIVTLETLREPVRLAEGLQNNHLNEKALSRAWEALERFGKRINGFQQHRVKAVATNTVRIAENAAHFLKSAEDKLGFKIKVISGQEEARLVYSGVCHAMPELPEKKLVVDIGGGSTEIITGKGDMPFLIDSFPMGSGSFSPLFFPQGKISSSALQEAEWQASLILAPMVEHYRSHDWEIAIGSSGTSRALAKVLKALELNPKGKTGITHEGLLRLSLYLLNTGKIDRQIQQMLPLGRSDILPAGLAIMLAVFKTLGIEEMIPSPPGLRMGLIHHLIHDKPVHELPRRH